METNEQLKLALVHEAEHEILKLIEQGETIPEGDLQTLEHSVLRGCLDLGRTMMEQIFNHTAQEAESPSRREGACGQKPRLGGRRPKQLHTLMGKVTIGRAYYQCVVEDGCTFHCAMVIFLGSYLWQAIVAQYRILEP